MISPHDDAKYWGLTRAQTDAYAVRVARYNSDQAHRRLQKIRDANRRYERVMDVVNIGVIIFLLIFTTIGLVFFR